MKMDTKKHSELGASSAERWVHCSASVKHIADIPPEPDSEHAAEGTRAHELLEKWLLHNRKTKFAFTLPKRLNLQEDSIAGVEFAVKRVENELKQNKFLKLEVEQRLSLAHIHPDMFGTGDITLYELFGKLKVADYKNGKGVRVKTEYTSDIGRTKVRSLNLQLMFYFIAVAKRIEYNFDYGEIEIIQPRIGVRDETKYSTSSVSQSDVVAYEGIFKAAIDRVFSPKARFEVGDWCRWCRGKATCNEYKKRATDRANQSAANDFA